MAADKQDKVLNVPTKGKVPNLRFPEFTDDWVLHPTTDYFEFKNGLNPDAKRFGSGTKFISVMDILNNRYITYDKIIASVKPKENDLKEFGVNYGDILFQRSSETLEDVGRANVYLDKETALFGGFVIRGKKIGEYNPLFFRYLLSCPHVRKRIVVKGAGAQHFNIGQDGLSKVALFVPSAKEQEQIANLLNLVDERIETQSRIIEDLKSLSDVICERLYNPSGKGVWQTYKYADLFSISNERNGKFQYKNVLSASQEYGMIERNELNIDIKFEESSITNYKIVRPNQYVIHLRSFQGGFAYSEKTGVCSPAYTILVPNEKLAMAFLKYYFTSKKFIDSLRIVTYGIRDGRSISVEEFLQLKVTIPDISQQNHIVRVMQLWEEKIRTEEAYLSRLQCQKMYLLSSMFV